MASDCTWKILQGPSREELFDSLRLKHLHLQPELTVKPTSGGRKFQMEVSILGIYSEDSTGNHWIIRFYAIGSTFDGFNFRGIYNTSTRTGSFGMMS